MLCSGKDDDHWYFLRLGQPILPYRYEVRLLKWNDTTIPMRFDGIAIQ